MVTLLAITLGSCDAVELRFADLGVDGLGQGDDVQPLRLCVEPQDPSSNPPPDGAAVPFEVGPACEPAGACPAPFDKCTLVDAIQDVPYEPVCVVSAGRRDIGECCERSVPGNDDCAPGGWCTPLGIGSVEEGPMACRAICREESECGQGRCLAVGDGVGLCVSSCRIFGADCVAPGIRCVAGATVDGNYFGYCARFGSGVSDEPCGSDANCGVDFVCEQDSATCRQMCDDDHPCPGAERCLPLGLGDPKSPRICRR